MVIAVWRGSTLSEKKLKLCRFSTYTEISIFMYPEALAKQGDNAIGSIRPYVYIE